MNKYLFVDYHNGHKTTYHPFLSDIDLSSADARKMQLEIYPEASRCGTCVEQMVKIIHDMGYNVANYVHPIYDVTVFRVCNPNLSEWKVIDGISGNY